MTRQPRKQRLVYDYPRPMVTVDLVVLTVMDDRLRVLLIRRGHPPFKGHWALPGGFVDIDESLEDAARRELAEETGLQLPRPAGRSDRRSSDVWMGQLRTFGRPGRDPRGRTITVVYLVLIRPGCVSAVRSGDDAADAGWFNVYRLPRLGFDHRDIIRCALERLRSDLARGGLAFRLLPAEFSLAELQQVHEMILRRPLDRRTFRRKIRALRMTEPAARFRRGRQDQPSRLYRYRPA